MRFHRALPEPPSPPAVHAGDVLLPKRVENRGTLVIGMVEFPSVWMLGTPRFQKNPAATTWAPNDGDEGDIGQPNNDDNEELGDVPGCPHRWTDEQQQRAQERHDEENAQEDSEPARETKPSRADTRRRGLSLDAR
jgi:hypothetical protein